MMVRLVRAVLHYLIAAGAAILTNLSIGAHLTPQSISAVSLLWGTSAFAHSDWQRRHRPPSRGVTVALVVATGYWLVKGVMDPTDSVTCLVMGIAGAIGYWADEIWRSMRRLLASKVA